MSHWAARGGAATAKQTALDGASSKTCRCSQGKQQTSGEQERERERTQIQIPPG